MSQTTEDMRIVLQNLNQLDEIAIKLSQEFKNKIAMLKQGINICQECQAHLDHIATKQK